MHQLLSSLNDQMPNLDQPPPRSGRQDRTLQPNLRNPVAGRYGVD